MIQFSLEKQKCKLLNLNPRAERHGEETVPACDLKLAFDCPNDVLSEFHPELKSSFYAKPDAATELFDDQPGYLPRLRFARLGTIAWDADIVGARVVVHYGLGGDSDVVLADAEVDGFRFDLKDGGTVSVSMRVKCKPSADQMGRLYGLIQSEVDVTLEPPEASS